MVYLGIDLGGTNIKTAVVEDDNYSILATADAPTGSERPAELVCDDIFATMHRALAEAGLTLGELGGIGIGCPGTIDGTRGVVTYSNNLGWSNFAMRDYFQEKTGLSPALGNDANVAALGEVAAGCAKGADSAVIITLGTGVGSGVVQQGKILTGYGGGASEIGHMVLDVNGPECTCGRRGCFEVFSSATGLIRMTWEAVQEQPFSRLAELAQTEGVTGRTAFDAMRAGDAMGKAVVDKYIQYLACGLTNVVNIFQPEVIALSGGISKEGEGLLTPLREQVYAQMFGGPGLRLTRFEACRLGYKAGLIGAAELARQAAAQAG